MRFLIKVNSSRAKVARFFLWGVVAFLLIGAVPDFGFAEGMAYRELQDVLREFNQPVNGKVTPVIFPKDGSSVAVPNLNVHSGEYIYVSLPSSGGTGYEWKLAPFPLRGVGLIGSKTRQTGDPGLVGGPVATDFLFQVKPGQKGGELVCFILYRSWEGVGKTAQIAAIGLQYL